MARGKETHAQREQDAGRPPGSHHHGRLASLDARRNASIDAETLRRDLKTYANANAGKHGYLNGAGARPRRACWADLADDPEALVPTAAVAPSLTGPPAASGWDIIQGLCDDRKPRVVKLPASLREKADPGQGSHALRGRG